MVQEDHGVVLVHGHGQDVEPGREVGGHGQAQVRHQGMEAQERGRAPSDVVQLGPHVVEAVGGADHGQHGEAGGQRDQGRPPRAQALAHPRDQQREQDHRGHEQEGRELRGEGEAERGPDRRPARDGRLLDHPEHGPEGQEGGQRVDHVHRRHRAVRDEVGVERAGGRGQAGRGLTEEAPADHVHEPEEQGERGHGGQARIEAEPVRPAHSEPLPGRLAGDGVGHRARRLGVVVEDGEPLRLARLHEAPRVGEVVGLVVGLALRPGGVEGGRDGEEDGGGGDETKDLQGSPRRAMNSACTSAKVRKPSRIQPFTVRDRVRPA